MKFLTDFGSSLMHHKRESILLGLVIRRRISASFWFSWRFSWTFCCWFWTSLFKKF